MAFLEEEMKIYSSVVDGDIVPGILIWKVIQAERRRASIIIRVDVPAVAQLGNPNIWGFLRVWSLEEAKKEYDQMMSVERRLSRFKIWRNG